MVWLPSTPMQTTPLKKLHSLRLETPSHSLYHHRFPPRVKRQHCALRTLNPSRLLYASCPSAFLVVNFCCYEDLNCYLAMMKVVLVSSFGHECMILGDFGKCGGILGDDCGLRCRNVGCNNPLYIDSLQARGTSRGSWFLKICLDFA